MTTPESDATSAWNGSKQPTSKLSAPGDPAACDAVRVPQIHRQVFGPSRRCRWGQQTCLGLAKLGGETPDLSLARAQFSPSKVTNLEGQAVMRGGVVGVIRGMPGAIEVCGLPSRQTGSWRSQTVRSLSDGLEMLCFRYSARHIPR
jgi:hypothetical protein